jgi:hypothetical protein
LSTQCSECHAEVAHKQIPNVNIHLTGSHANITPRQAAKLKG